MYFKNASEAHADMLFFNVDHVILLSSTDDNLNLSNDCGRNLSAFVELSANIPTNTSCNERSVVTLAIASLPNIL
jgi:hypothetical protein